MLLSALFSIFITGLFLIFFSLSPNIKVFLVSTVLHSCFEQFIIKVVYALPPKQSLNIRVNLLSRYGAYEILSDSFDKFWTIIESY